MKINLIMREIILIKNLLQMDVIKTKVNKFKMNIKIIQMRLAKNLIKFLKKVFKNTKKVN